MKNPSEILKGRKVKQKTVSVYKLREDFFVRWQNRSKLRPFLALYCSLRPRDKNGKQYYILPELRAVETVLISALNLKVIKCPTATGSTATVTRCQLDLTPKRSRSAKPASSRSKARSKRSAKKKS